MRIIMAPWLLVLVICLSVAGSTADDATGNCDVYERRTMSVVDKGKSVGVGAVVTDLADVLINDTEDEADGLQKCRDMCCDTENCNVYSVGFVETAGAYGCELIQCEPADKCEYAHNENVTTELLKRLGSSTSSTPMASDSAPEEDDDDGSQTDDTDDEERQQSDGEDDNESEGTEQPVGTVEQSDAAEEMFHGKMNATEGPSDDDDQADDVDDPVEEEASDQVETSEREISEAPQETEEVTEAPEETEETDEVTAAPEEAATDEGNDDDDSSDNQGETTTGIVSETTVVDISDDTTVAVTTGEPIPTTPEPTQGETNTEVTTEIPVSLTDDGGDGDTTVALQETTINDDQTTIQTDPSTQPVVATTAPGIVQESTLAVDTTPLTTALPETLVTTVAVEDSIDVDSDTAPQSTAPVEVLVTGTEELLTTPSVEEESNLATLNVSALAEQVADLLDLDTNGTLLDPGLNGTSYNQTGNYTDTHADTTADKSKFDTITIPTIVAIFSFSLILIIVVSILVGKRCYEGYRRRHYQKVSDFI